MKRYTPTPEERRALEAHGWHCDSDGWWSIPREAGWGRTYREAMREQAKRERASKSDLHRDFRLQAEPRALFPVRLPDGRIRCEFGSGFGSGGDARGWCRKPATWVIEGFTPRSPGAVVCGEHRGLPRPNIVWTRLDNPAAPDAAKECAREAEAARDAERDVLAEALRGDRAPPVARSTPATFRREDAHG